MANDLATKEKEEILEPGDLDSYMDEDNAGAEKPTDDEWKNYLHGRYAQIKEGYKVLLVTKREAAAGKRHEWENSLNDKFSENYKQRKVVVRELRKVGEKIVDPFVTT